MIIEWQRHLTEREMRIKDAACQITSQETAAMLLFLIKKRKIPVSTLSVILCCTVGQVTSWTHGKRAISKRNLLFRRMVWMIYRTEALQIYGLSEMDMATWGRMHPERPLSIDGFDADPIQPKPMLDPSKPWVFVDWRKPDCSIALEMECNISRVRGARASLRMLSKSEITEGFLKAGSNPDYAAGLFKKSKAPKPTEDDRFEAHEEPTHVDWLIEKTRPGWVKSQLELDGDYLASLRPLLVEL